MVSETIDERCRRITKEMLAKADVIKKDLEDLKKDLLKIRAELENARGGSYEK